MRRFRLHILMIFIAVFVLGSVASSAMAHCGHNGFTAGDGISMEIPGHDDKSGASSCGTHDHGSASAIDSASHNPSDHSSNPVECDDCSGVPCQSKIQVPQDASPVQCIGEDKIHSQTTLHFKDIFLTIIPHPPNKIS